MNFIGDVAVNIVVNLFANYKLFHVATELKAVELGLPKQIGGLILSVVAPILIGLGGIIEGLFAETYFLQSLHLIAFVVLVFGLIVSGGIYGVLFEYLMNK